MICAHPQLDALARAIAFVWAPALGRERALEAARNAVAPLAFPDAPPFVICAASALEHRRRVFGWPATESTVDVLALQAVRVWIAKGRPGDVEARGALHGEACA